MGLAERLQCTALMHVQYQDDERIVQLLQAGARYREKHQDLKVRSKIEAYQFLLGLDDPLSLHEITVGDFRMHHRKYYTWSSIKLYDDDSYTLIARTIEEKAKQEKYSTIAKKPNNANIFDDAVRLKDIDMDTPTVVMVRLACVILNLCTSYYSFALESMYAGTQVDDIRDSQYFSLLGLLQVAWHREQQQTFKAIEYLLTMPTTSVYELQMLRIQAINHFLDLAAGVLCKEQSVPPTALLHVLISAEQERRRSSEYLSWLQWRNTLPALLAEWSATSLLLNPKNEVAKVLQAIPAACLQTLCAARALNANQRAALDPIILQLLALSSEDEDQWGCARPDEAEESRRVLSLVAQLTIYALEQTWELPGDLAAIGMFGAVGAPTSGAACKFFKAFGT